MFQNRNEKTNEGWGLECVVAASSTDLRGRHSPFIDQLDKLGIHTGCRTEHVQFSVGRLDQLLARVESADANLAVGTADDLDLLGTVRFRSGTRLRLLLLLLLLYN